MSKDQTKIGRVHHVRASVRGPKYESFECFHSISKKRLMCFARLFRPTLAGANMGHPSGFVWSLRSGSHTDSEAFTYPFFCFHSDGSVVCQANLPWQGLKPILFSSVYGTTKVVP